MLTSGIELYKDIYKVKEEFLYGTKKEMIKLFYDLGVLQSINKNLSLGATLRYINNDSNQNIYEYDKYVVRTNIYYSF